MSDDVRMGEYVEVVERSWIVRGFRIARWGARFLMSARLATCSPDSPEKDIAALTGVPSPSNRLQA